MDSELLRKIAICQTEGCIRPAIIGTSYCTAHASGGSMTLDQFLTQSHTLAREKGFWDDEFTPSRASVNLANMAYRLLGFSDSVELIRKGQYINAHNEESMSRTFKVEELTLLSKLVLLASEIGEACEALLVFNFNSKDNIEEELADIGIRYFDLLKWWFGSSEAAELEINQKHQKNRSRPKRHGKEA